MLLQQLPQESAFVTAVRGGYWTQTDELLASLIEMTSVTHRLVYVSGGGKEEWELVHVDRPGEPEPQPDPDRFASVHELKAFMMRTGGG